jgi:Ca2+/Na+ antiporter
MYFILVPHRVWKIYLTDGLSRRFAQVALCAFMLILTQTKLSKLIGHETCKVLMIPAIIGFLAIYEWHIDFIALAIALVFVVIIFAVLMICHKYGDDEV